MAMYKATVSFPFFKYVRPNVDYVGDHVHIEEDDGEMARLVYEVGYTKYVRPKDYERIMETKEKYGVPSSVPLYEENGNFLRKQEVNPAFWDFELMPDMNCKRYEKIVFQKQYRSRVAAVCDMYKTCYYILADIINDMEEDREDINKITALKDIRERMKAYHLLRDNKFLDNFYYKEVSDEKEEK